MPLRKSFSMNTFPKVVNLILMMFKEKYGSRNTSGCLDLGLSHQNKGNLKSNHKLKGIQKKSWYAFAFIIGLSWVKIM